MIIVSGHSDDIIGIGGDVAWEEFTYIGEHNHPSNETGDLLAFSDGTVLRITFTDSGVWRIVPVVRGSSALRIEQAAEDDDRTDVATVDGAVWVVHGIALVKR